MPEGATGANVTHEELQAQFFPLGEWPEKDTRERIQFIINEGLQAGETWSCSVTHFEPKHAREFPASCIRHVNAGQSVTRPCD